MVCRPLIHRSTAAYLAAALLALLVALALSVLLPLGSPGLPRWPERGLRGVVTSPDGTPLPFATVEVVNPGKWATVLDLDEQGRFHFRAPLEDSLQVVASLPGPSRRYARRTSVPADPSQPLTLVVDPEPSITVLVADWPAGLDGVPCTLMVESTGTSDEEAGGVMVARIDSYGRARFPALTESARYQVWAHLRGHDSYVLARGVRAGPARVEHAKLQGGLQIEGTLVGLESATHDVSVQAVSRDLGVVALGTWDGTRSFSVRGLPRGEWRINAHARGSEIRVGHRNVPDVPAKEVTVTVR